MDGRMHARPCARADARTHGTVHACCSAKRMHARTHVCPPVYLPPRARANAHDNLRKQRLGRTRARAHARRVRCQAAHGEQPRADALQVHRCASTRARTRARSALPRQARRSVMHSPALCTRDAALRRIHARISTHALAQAHGRTHGCARRFTDTHKNNTGHKAHLLKERKFTFFSGPFGGAAIVSHVGSALASHRAETLCTGLGACLQQARSA